MIPGSWTRVLCEDSFDQVSTSNKKVKSKDCQLEGKYPVVDQGQVTPAGYVDDDSKLIRVEKPVCVFGDHTRAVKWIDHDFVPGADGTKILDPKPFLHPRYFYYQLKAINLPDKGYSRHFKYLREADFLIPPLPEQIRIAEKLDELLSGVEQLAKHTRSLLMKIDLLRRSVIRQGVFGRLTETRRNSDPYVERDGFNIPKSWVLETAQDACCKVQSGSTPKGNPFEQNGTVPFLKVYNIVDHEVNFDYKPQFITLETHNNNLKRSVSLPGDVLMNIVGPPLGKIAIVTNQYPEWNINQAITLFRPKEHMTSKYLYYLLREGTIVDKILPETRGQVGQVNISLTQCRNSLLPRPSYDEQLDIVEKIETILATIGCAEKRLENSHSLFASLSKALLDKAFRGELVPQDPNDEPASELLARIQRERKETKKSKPREKKTKSA